MYKYLITAIFLSYFVFIGCDEGSSSRSMSVKSYGSATAGPVLWKGAGYKFARSMITYKNDTIHTFKMVQIQCIAKNSNGDPVSDFPITYSVALGYQPISPGTTKIEEAVFSNGSQVKTVSCSVERAR